MENQQKGKTSTQEQQTGTGKNPTLNEQGTKVPDYGNVMGGSADTNVEQGRQQEGDDRRAGKEKKDTQ